MVDEATINFIIEVLKITSEAEIHDELYWDTYNTNAVTFYFVCNDTFYYASSDAEVITPENLPILKQAIIDAEEADPVLGTLWAATLFCARVRNTRPLQSVLDSIDIPAVRELFLSI